MGKAENFIVAGVTISWKCESYKNQGANSLLKGYFLEDFSKIQMSFL